jgi:hypothetical protein
MESVGAVEWVGAVKSVGAEDPALSEKGCSLRLRLLGSRSRHLANRCGYIGARSMASHEGFNLALGLAPRFAKECLRIVVGEMRAEKTQSRDMHPSVFEMLQNHRVPARCPSHLNALVGGVFRQAQALSAKREHRRTRVLAIKAPAIYLANGADEIGIGTPMFASQGLKRFNESVVRQRTERSAGHLLFIA